MAGIITEFAPRAPDPDNGRFNRRYMISLAAAPSVLGCGEIEAHLHDVLDVRLAALPPQTRALVRSMLTAPEAAAQMSAFLNERATNLSRAMSGDDADLRAALTVSSILGLIIARHFLQLDAFARASDAEIARVARPWVTTGVDPATGQHSRTSTPAG